MSTVENSISTISSPALPPLPYLPLEVKGHILRFCDPRTLFATSLVSLAFLELSSPILYEDVTVRSVKQLADLLCVEIEYPQPQLERHLSLSLIRNLTFIEDQSEFSDSIDLVRLSIHSRLERTTGSLLLLDGFFIVADSWGWNRTSSHSRNAIGSLLRHLQPVSLSFVADVGEADGGGNLPFTLINLNPLDHWIRLNHLTFVNTFPSSTVIHSGFLSLERGPPVGLRYDLSQLPNSNASEALFNTLLEDLTGQDDDAPLDPEEVEKRFSRIGEVEVVVGTEERRTSVLEGLAGASLLARTKVVVRAQS